MNKKRILAVAAGCLLFSATAFSQGLHLGVKAGVNANKIDGQGFDNGFDYSYLLGGFVQLPLAHGLGLQPEVLFVQSQTTRSNDPTQPFDAGNAANKNVRLNYLAIPVMLNIGSSAVKLQAGAQYGILIDKHNTLLTNGQEAFKSGDFSLGGGFQWQLPVFGLHLGGRYLVGLNDVNDAVSSEKWKSQSLQLSTGITF